MAANVVRSRSAGSRVAQSRMCVHRCTRRRWWMDRLGHPGAAQRRPAVGGAPGRRRRAHRHHRRRPARRPARTARAAGGEPTLDDLAARGLVIAAPPAGPAGRREVAVPVWAGARLDRLLARYGARPVTPRSSDTSRPAGPLPRRPRPRRRARRHGRRRRLVRVGAGPDRGARAGRPGDRRRWPSATTCGRALRDDWERIHVVPVDQRCLDRAAELGREPAAAHRRRHPPRRRRPAARGPSRSLTFDPRQIPVALALGFDVVSA